MRGRAARLAWPLLAAITPAQQVDTPFSLGLKAYAAEQYEQAMAYFEQAIQAEPAVARHHEWYGKACGRRAERVFFPRALGLARKVRSSFEKAVELEPTNVEALSELFEFYLRAPGLVGGGEDKARAVVERIRALDAAEGHRTSADMLLKSKDFAGAEQQLRKALELEPAKLARLLDLASLLAERGRHREADALFDRAAELAPNAPAYLFARGKQLALSRRDPQQARQMLERYLRSQRGPDDPPPSEVRELLKKL